MELTDYTNCAQLLKIIGHPVRLAILDSLKDGEKCVNDVCQLLKTAQPNISQHLSVLRTVGILNVTENGSWRCYSIANHEMIKGILDLLNEFCMKKQREAKFAADNTGAP